jgi:hypothetical protein
MITESEMPFQHEFRFYSEQTIAITILDSGASKPEETGGDYRQALDAVRKTLEPAGPLDWGQIEKFW